MQDIFEENIDSILSDVVTLLAPTDDAFKALAEKVRFTQKLVPWLHPQQMLLQRCLPAHLLHVLIVGPHAYQHPVSACFAAGWQDD